MNTVEKNNLSVSKLPAHFVSVKGSNMHYYDEGTGEPILFLHGIPTSSYVWRHIIPALSSDARCIAPDLIGMGQSDKPDIDYRLTDHIDYIEAFVDALKLKNITLVLHGWGSAIGFELARRHPQNIKAIAFYEAHIKPVTQYNQLSLPVQQFATMLNRPGASYRAVVLQNYFIEKLLPRSIIRELSEEEMTQYRAPFLTEDSRKPLWQYVNELPLGNGPEPIVNLMQGYSTWLQSTQIPKLMIYAVPGFITTIDDVRWAREHFPNLETISLDDALHLAQESIPEQFAEALVRWYKKV